MPRPTTVPPALLAAAAGTVALALAPACQSASPAVDAGALDAAAVSDAAAVDAAVADADTRPLPDLTVDVGRARADLAIRERRYADDACELDPEEACVGGPGDRRLLHFSVETPNVGNADLVLGAPTLDNPQFAFSTCHEHYHFEGYAEYRLLDAARGEVAVGRKQAFCLLDSSRYLDGDDVAADPRYGCDFQGIQRGWSDVYHSRLPCQFIDVTDVADGAYTLEIRINNGGALEELALGNNLATVAVELGGAALASPTEPCADDLPAHATRGANRECGWTLAEVVDCIPEQQVHVGCAEACGLGSCTGDPQLRVCDADRPDGNCSYPAAIGDDDDACGSSCPAAAFTRCPDSGHLAVYTAPSTVGAPYTCDVAVRPVGG